MGRGGRSGCDRRPATAAWARGVGIAAAVALSGCGVDEPPAEKGHDPAAVAPARYVGSERCAGCHAEEHLRWRGSHHDLAMQEATPETVLGDFDDAQFGRFPVLTRFFRRDGAFFVNTEGPDGQRGDFAVKYTFGVEPLQQYLIEMPGGRLQSLTVAWDTEKRAWFDLYPDERNPPGDALHWTGRYQNWNGMCAACHSTGLRVGYDPENDRYETTYEEIDVGCEACHGPASRHVAAAEERKEQGGAPAAGELPLAFDAADPGREIDACAPCHSRRHQLVAEPTPGAPFLDDYMPALLRDGLYHPDGQIDAEVYVYGSYLQSAMHRAGVRCSDCHDPHDLLLLRPGNALCTECHQVRQSPRFPTLKAADYDTPEHHFHPDGSAGAQCVACHMPEKTYMQVDPRRDHNIRVPRPDLSAELLTPNACTGCHGDRDSEWAAAEIVARRGGSWSPPPHFARAIAAARRGDPGALEALERLAMDPDTPGIVRATAVEQLGAFRGPAIPAIVTALGDADPLVRAAAVAALDGTPVDDRIEHLAPLLDDPLRAVRVEAARVLADVPPARFGSNRRDAYRRAFSEFEAAQGTLADRPEAHLNLAVVKTRRGDMAGAESAYRRALELDPGFLPVYFNLGGLYNRAGRNDDAERVFRRGLVRFPDEGELHYSLGLLLAEQGRVAEATKALGEAVRRLPDRPRVIYNLALALQHAGRLEEAELTLLRAAAIAPADPDITHALAIFYLQQGDLNRAKTFAERLVAMLPDAPGPAELLEHVEARLSGAPPR